MLQTRIVLKVHNTSLQYIDSEIEGWTFALQTYSVLKAALRFIMVHNGYNTKTQSFQGARFTLASQTLNNVLKVHSAFNTKIPKYQGGRSRYKRVV